MKENNFYIEFVYEYQSFSGKEISFFLKNIIQNFNPIEMLGYDNFDNNLYEIIEEEDFKFRAISVFSSNKEVFNVSSAIQSRLIPRRKYTIIRYFNKNFILEYNELLYLLNIGNIKIGFQTDNKYWKIQSDDNPQSYKYINPYKYGTNEKEIKEYEEETGLLLYFNENCQLWCVDISNNPGRERFLPGMKFIPAYKIWYGKEAQELFGKQKILDYPNAIYTKKLENGVIEMQLMDDITKCDLPYNQEKQRDIVKYFEIEKLEVSKY